MQPHHEDVLVVGAGIAGLVTALSVRRRRVTILCPSLPPLATGSSFAQGGIAAAIADDDTPELHAEDTLSAGAGLCIVPRVQLLCRKGPSAIRWLERQGVRFDRDGENIALHREAAHRRARVLHIDGDGTGNALVSTLVHAARAAPNIEFRTGFVAVSLIRNENAITGVIACDEKAQPLAIRAHDTVIATGGLGQLYRYTSNPRSACGDGLAMAIAAGAACNHLEFVQFHPTALLCDDDPLPLITEALRGAGAWLVDGDSRRFMTRVHPDAELAPRDVVARAVWKQVQSGTRIYLDAREVFRKDPKSFPSVRSTCSKHGIDPATDCIPVTPAAHYHMGGIVVDADGRTNLENLWACGEVACTGVHGANRLASNSLLEAVVFGRQLGAALSVADSSRRIHSLNTPELTHVTPDIDAKIWASVRQLMWDCCGIERNARMLIAARTQLGSLLRRTAHEQVLLRGRIRLAQEMIGAALARLQSVGAHCRVDDDLCQSSAAKALELSADVSG